MNEEGREPDAAAARRAARPYSIAVGVLFLIVIVIAGINAIDNEDFGLGPGDRLPKFAAPSATGSIDKDANVDPSKACKVSPRDAVRVCDFFDRPFVMVVWFTKGCGTCRRQLDVVEAIRSRFRNVGFLGLDVRDSLENAREEVREHGWRFPMALDRDGAVSGLYGVSGGPTIFFAYPGGVLMEKYLGELDRAALTRRVRVLVQASHRRERAQSQR